MSLLDAAAGTRLAALTRLRDMLAEDLDGCTSLRDKAALSQRFMDVLAQIDDLGGGEKPAERETGLSDFEKRLRQRESGSKAPRRAKSS